MRGMLLPTANQLHLEHAFYSPQNLLEEIQNSSANMLMINQSSNQTEPVMMPVREVDQEIPKPLTANRPPEKRKRVPSAYHRFIKEEIQRIKAGNPYIRCR
ncbi:hypothetical protein Q3G72_024058 [Acer saccharum]|nr:hypothetical protein Q3G72_024058 [Acer saccharum]